MKLLTAAFFLGNALFLQAQTTYTDDFSTTHDYVSDGIAGTIWDGLYLGANEIAQPMGTGMAAGKTSVALASNGVLTVTSLQTDWESAADDGFFLFKIVSGDFDMSVQIAGPIDTRAHNFPGLMVRAFGPGGAPAPNDKENFLIMGRFDEYSIANMQKNETDGVKRDKALGTFPNTNDWLRLQRIGSVFNLFEKGSATDEWKPVGSVTRTNFDRPLQVGIEHADYDGGRVLSARYKNFTLTASNLGPFLPEPAAATGLKVETATVNYASGSKINISWTAAPGSSGSLVMLWRGSPVLKELPVNGTTYHGNPEVGERPPAENFIINYAGAGTNVTVSLGSPDSVHVAVFSYVGEGKTITYSRHPARSDP